MRTFPRLFQRLMKVGLRRGMRRYARANRAVAAVEFALILPFMMMLYMGSIEVSWGISADRRVQIVAGSIGDLVSQSEDTLAQSALNDYFAAASVLMQPFDSNALKVRVNCIKVNSNGTTEVYWSEGYNGATALTNGAAYDLPTHFKNLALNSYVIVGEAYYEYQPVMSYVFSAPFHIYHEYVYVPRYNDKIDIT